MSTDSPPTEASPATPLRSVWFDCDSTLSHIEGIDELALAAGPSVAARVARLTHDAMEGGVPLERVYAARLDAIRPDRRACEAVALRYIARAVIDARDVCAALRHLGKQLGILSGGLRPCVLGLAEHLGIPADHVHAVDVRFDSAGGYAGFDARSPLARSGGKPDLLRELDFPRPSALVGDGITDLEAGAVVERFVGFGGVVHRDAVATRAVHFADGPGLTSALLALLTLEEQAALRAERRFEMLVGPAPDPHS